MSAIAFGLTHFRSLPGTWSVCGGDAVCDFSQFYSALLLVVMMWFEWVQVEIILDFVGSCEQEQHLFLQAGTCRNDTRFWNLAGTVLDFAGDCGLEQR